MDDLTPGNFSKLHLGPLAEALDGDFEGRYGKYFLRKALKLSGCEASLTRMKSGTGMPFMHQHVENEELYIVFRGNGLFHIDGEEFPVSEGSLIRVSPTCSRAWKAGDQDLYMVCIQSKAESMASFDTKDGRPAPGKASWFI